MGTMYMMIGLPGSGKSTIANEIGKELGIPVVSSDEVRKEVTSSEEDFSKDGYIWGEVIPNKLKSALLKGDVIFDATNLRVRDRNKTKKAIGLEHEYQAIYVDVPLEICIERQGNRDRKVPPERIEEMYKEMVPPTIGENFSQIYTVNVFEDFLHLKGIYNNIESNSYKSLD